MKKEFRMSEQSEKVYLIRILKLLGATVALAIISAVLGLKRFTHAQYPFVSFVIMAVTFLFVNIDLNLGGRLDTKEDKKAAQKKYMIISGIACGAAWLFMIITNLAVVLVTFVFVFDLLILANIAGAFWSMIKNLFHSAGEGEHYPGDIILHDVHTGRELTSRFGKVLIRNNTVLFVMPEYSNCLVEVTPDGDMQIWKRRFFNTSELKESNVRPYDIMRNAENGSSFMIELLRQECNKRNIPLPKIVYDYVVYLPHFERKNCVWDMDSFRSLSRIHFWNEDKEYAKYLEKASKADYFSGKACYDMSQIGNVMNYMVEEGKNYDPNAQETGELIAQLLVDACGLAPKQS